MKKLFHISDIHIRNGDKRASRYQEYSTVFDNLFISLKDNIAKYRLNKNDYLIIITGDIFHNKNVIGNFGLELYNKFIKGLTDIGTTIIFHGNHDRNQNEIDQPSLISSTIEIENLRILKSTQSFVINDIGYSYMNIDDTLDKTSTVGRVKNLPEFPDISSNVSKKVALFHGTFGNVKLYNGTQVLNSTNPYPFEWISHFDFALLGDIHLRQKGMYGNLLWGYAGSLVQQNYGEDIINHGYMIWDMETNSIENVNVYNPYGYINIVYQNNDIYIRKRGKYDVLLSDVVTNEYFPKNIEIRTYTDISVDGYAKLYDIFNTYGIKYKCLRNRLTSKKIENKAEKSLQVNKDTFIEYLNTIIPKEYYDKAVDIIKNTEILLFDIINCPEELVEECNKKNKDISLLIKTYNTNTIINGNKNIKYPFCIEYLEWDNLFCYEKGNSINFANAINSTLLICGNNGTGKSAIYDIISLAIWGVVTKDKQSQFSKNCIINYKHNKAITSIDISINGKKYNIKRTFNTVSKNNIEIYEYIDLEKILIKKNNACMEFIKDNLGTLDDFLTCSMITQVVDNDILRMDYKECTAIIDKASNINEIYELFNLLKLSLNKYKDYKKTIENKREVYKHIVSKNVIDNSNKSELLLSLQDSKLKYEKLMEENNRIDIDINSNNYTDLLKHEFEYQKELEKNTYKELCDELNELKVYFKTKSYDEILAISKEYNSEIVLPEKYDKPCEYAFIKDEKAYVSQYNLDIKSDADITAIQLEYDNLICEINKIESTKPNKANKPLRDISEIQKDISIIFKGDDSLKLLNEFIYDNKQYVNNTLTELISYECYLKLLELEAKLTKELQDYDTNHIQYDKELQELYVSKKELQVEQEPDNKYDISIGVVNDIYKTEHSIESNNSILNNCYENLEKLDKLNGDLVKYNNELSNLKSNKDNDYDPKCKYCCNRPWVKRIKVLETIIYETTQKIAELNDNIYVDTNIDYIKVFNDNESNKNKLFNTELYNSWNTYNNYLSTCRQIDDNISSIITKISDESNKKKDSIKLLETIRIDIDKFKINTNILYNELAEYHDYEMYCKYLELYYELGNKKNICENKIKYKRYIEPRIIKLKELEYSYNKWYEYNRFDNIIKSHRYIELSKIIFDEEVKILNNNNKTIKEKIIRKRQLIDSISECNNNIKDITEKVAQIETIEKYNNNNVNNYNYYSKELTKINEVITILDIIISNFKDYKINLYKNHILKRLIDNANDYIKDLCHEDTKKFKLDYMINQQKDIIHINWLIHNVTNDNIEQVISINQASGFQRFVISLALRMSLYSNTQCEQIFIDEGFTACDKQNLSLVPVFLKNLLNTFSGVIIMSHIDIIKDSMDIVANIEYNKNTKVSSIKYNI